MFIVHSVIGEVQTGGETSHVGGTPALPEGVSVPVFEKTGAEMTFFFQFAFPYGHAWEGNTLSVFSATDYVDDDTFIPKTPVPLAAAELNDAFFEDYQSFFKIYIFRTSTGRRVSAF